MVVLVVVEKQKRETTGAFVSHCKKRGLSISGEWSPEKILVDDALKLRYKLRPIFTNLAQARSPISARS